MIGRRRSLRMRKEGILTCLLVLLFSQQTGGVSGQQRTQIVASSLRFSDIPSDIPSMKPSSTPTAGNAVLTTTEVPTLRSASSSAPPSSLLQLRQFQAPSDVPSDVPSDAPSDIPSGAPSYKPSPSPTVPPTFAPTSAPSQRPSLSPSLLPSDGPTKRPSTAPSSMPSTVPTISCHDEASYRSPINNFTCMDHQGTDCASWRFLGLDADELEDLVDSCPVSCQIDCGSFDRFEVKVSFRVMSVPNFLDPSSVTALEEVSVDYLTNFVKAEQAGSEVFLYNVELTSQQIQETIQTYEGSTRRQLRRVQVADGSPANVDLLVAVAFRGFAIDLDTQTVKTSIIQGIDSEGYSRAIQRSGDSAFLDVEISSAVTNNAPPSVNQNGSDGSGGGGSSPGGKAAAAAIVGVSFAGMGLAFLFVRQKKKRKLLSQSSAKEFHGRTLSPVNSRDEAPRSPLERSVFSFEGSLSAVAGLIQIMSSGSPRSNDSSTRSGETGDTSRPSIKQEPTPSAKRQSAETESEEEEEEEEEHPFTGIIPPMIVIDNIEDEYDFKSESSKKKKKSRARDVVPSQHIHASSELAAALIGTNSFDQSAFSGELFSQPGNQRPARSAHGSPAANAEDAEEVVGSQALTAIPHMNSTDELEALVDELEHSALGDSSLIGDSGSPRLKVICPPRASRPGQSPSSKEAPSKRPTDSSPRSTSTSSYGSKKAISFDNIETAKSRSKEDDQSAAQSADKSKDSTSSKPSFWGWPPAKSIKRSSSNTSLPDRAPSLFSNLRVQSKGSASSNEAANPDDPVKHTFRAPRKGKLGLLIECNSTGGPIIVRVKDYSPLLGQVQPGDKIVKVDGVSTVNMPLSEITSLLGSDKASVFAGSVIQIVVLRRPSKHGAGANDKGHGQGNAGSFDTQSWGSSSHGGGYFSDTNTSSDSFPFKM